MTTTTAPDPTTTMNYQNLKDLLGYKVEATDGEIGKIVDSYFDDVTWKLRYFVVETGSWFNKQRVLVSPAAFTGVDDKNNTVSTTMTRKQIEDSPRADLAKPVSRQYEAKLHDYFAWPMYWLDAPAKLKRADGDSHLRSVSEVLSYGVRAEGDDVVGRAEDVIVEDGSWVIRYLALDTRQWLPGRTVLISPTWIDDISWADKKIEVDMKRDTIEKAPKYDPSQPIDRGYEEELFAYYRRPKFWV
jgi:hypothetical protein